LKLRKEHGVFAATLVILGWLAWQSRAEGVVRGSGGKKATPPVLDVHRVPDASLALPASLPGARPADHLPPRDLFSPPSDTHPLPPLAFQPIPLARSRCSLRLPSRVRCRPCTESSCASRRP
jgi:hypothetical protein